MVRRLLGLHTAVIAEPPSLDAINVELDAAAEALAVTHGRAAQAILGNSLMRGFDA